MKKNNQVFIDVMVEQWLAHNRAIKRQRRLTIFGFVSGAVIAYILHTQGVWL